MSGKGAPFKQEYMLKSKGNHSHFQGLGVIQVNKRRLRSRAYRIPEGWLRCRSCGDAVADAHILAMKVPLDEKFYVTSKAKFTPATFLESQAALGRKVGLVVDLTYTEKYYNGTREFEEKGVEYIKIRERGHSAIPDRSNLEFFKASVRDFWARRPDEYVGVHCTHGLNRSGFFIVTLLVELLGRQLVDALRAFAIASPPGIWDRDYILALYRVYALPEPSKDNLPDPPSWRNSDFVTMDKVRSNSPQSRILPARGKRRPNHDLVGKATMDKLGSVMKPAWLQSSKARNFHKDFSLSAGPSFQRSLSPTGGNHSRDSVERRSTNLSGANHLASGASDEFSPIRNETHFEKNRLNAGSQSPQRTIRTLPRNVYLKETVRDPRSLIPKQESQRNGLACHAKGDSPTVVNGMAETASSAKVVIVMRGLPGSGKTTYVRRHYDQAHVCSADHFFTGVSGEYRYEPYRLPEAHQACLESFIIALENRLGTIVVDNTNSASWEYANYLRLAKMCGYAVKVLEMECKSMTWARAFYQRCQHDVPWQSLLRMWERWEPDHDAVLVAPFLEKRVIEMLDSAAHDSAQIALKNLGSGQQATSARVDLVPEDMIRTILPVRHLGDVAREDSDETMHTTQFGSQTLEQDLDDGCTAVGRIYQRWQTNSNSRCDSRKGRAKHRDVREAHLAQSRCDIPGPECVTRRLQPTLRQPDHDETDDFKAVSVDTDDVDSDAPIEPPAVVQDGNDSHSLVTPSPIRLETSPELLHDPGAVHPSAVDAQAGGILAAIGAYSKGEDVACVGSESAPMGAECHVEPVMPGGWEPQSPLVV